MHQPQAPTSAPQPSPSVAQPSQYFRSPSQDQPLNPPASPLGLVLPQQLPFPHTLQPAQADHTQAGLTQEQLPQPVAPTRLPAHTDATDCSRARPGPKDFCLIAEAAKRAQLDVLMRDLSEVAL